MKKQRVAAVIGCGKYVEGKVGWAIGHAHATGYRQADPNLRLLGVDVSPVNLAAFGERFGVAAEDLFPSTEALYAAGVPDYVSVCTWPGLHAPLVIEAASQDVSGIICEKPMALDGREIDLMLAACRESGTRLAVAHQRCHGPLFKMARELLRSGVIGGEWVLEARVGEGWDMLSWSIHWMDIAHWLFGAAPLSVMAGLDHTGQRRYQQAIENGSVVFVEYPEHRQAIFITGPDNHQEGEGLVFIRGTEGMMRIGGKLEVWNRAQGYQMHPAPEGAPDDFATLITDLFSCVENGGEMQCDAERSAISTRTAYAAHESARTMRRIAAPFVTKYAPLEVVQHPAKPAVPTGAMVLFADEHFGSEGREGIFDALKETTGETPVLIDASKGLTGADLEGAGVLLLYHTQTEPDDATKDALTGWIESGKPTVFVHAALGGYPNWEQYKRWCGRVWAWGPGGSEHPYEESMLTAVSSEFAPWAEAWLPNDEVFIKLAPTSQIEVMAEVKISKGIFPAAWRSREFNNIAAWVPGHWREMWTIPAMREGLIASIQLAARPAR